MEVIQTAHRLHCTPGNHHRRPTARTSSRTVKAECQMCAGQHLIPTRWLANSEMTTRHQKPPQSTSKKVLQSTSMAWTKPIKAKEPTGETTSVFKMAFTLSRNSTQAKQRKRRRNRKKSRRKSTNSSKSTTTNTAIQLRGCEHSTRRLRPNFLP
jgi:hypothetical protein